MRRGIIVLFFIMLSALGSVHGQSGLTAPLPPEGKKKVSPTPSPSPGASPNAKNKIPALPSEAVYYAEKGNEAFIHDDLENAQKYYEKVVSIAPDNLLALVNMGAVYYRLKKYPEAEEALKKAISHEIRTPAAWMTLGLTYLEQERLDEAFGALSMAVAYEPNNSKIHNYLGVVAGQKGWYDGAEKELRRSLELDPKSNEANYNLAVFYLDQKPPAVELARRHYRRALELGAEPDPDLEKKLEKQ